MVHTEPDNFYLLLTFIKTCIMKKILLMLASAFFMFSCSQEEGTSPINENTSNLPVSAQPMRNSNLPNCYHKPPPVVSKYATS